MRIAILSDIHGNCVALDAVLADIQAQSQEVVMAYRQGSDGRGGGRDLAAEWRASPPDGAVDGYWILGDLTAIGAQPLAVMERLRGLPNARFVRGNSERYLITGARPFPSQAEALADQSLLPLYVEVLESFAWSAGALAAGGHLPFLLDIPLEERLTLSDGNRALLVHASPGTDDGHGFLPRYSDEEVSERLDGCEADLLCVGHTHWPQSFHLNGVHVVNPGSIGNPLIPSLRATYAILEADESGYRVEHRAVDYDKQLAEKMVWEARHPAAAYISSFLRGERVRPWGEPEVLR